MKDIFANLISVLVGAIILLGFTYLIAAGLSYLVCFGFGFHWTWKLAVGWWALWAGFMIVVWCVIRMSFMDEGEEE